MGHELHFFLLLEIGEAEEKDDEEGKKEEEEEDAPYTLVSTAQDGKRMTPSVEKSWHSSVSGGKTAYSSVPGTAVDGCGDRVSGADGVQARV